MNEKANQYWCKFWQGKEMPESVKAEQFGFDPDILAQLVIEGKKTATSSAYVLYELENEQIPAIDSYRIILNSNEEPVAIIKNVDVRILPMNKVPHEHAIAEGEGDLSYEHWRNGHKTAFTMDLEEHGMAFSEDMLVVCERFALVDVKTIAL
ncbi:MAG: ASCH domain-containing protein [Defluviitaleaceae bacterium]|nr:ASCH domain-containing protein [Defluviitaleaceae bacterium]